MRLEIRLDGGSFKKQTMLSSRRPHNAFQNNASATIPFYLIMFFIPIIHFSLSLNMDTCHLSTRLRKVNQVISQSLSNETNSTEDVVLNGKLPRRGGVMGTIVNYCEGIPCGRLRL